MAYEYIKRTYAFQPEVGRRVRHTVIDEFGVIAPEYPSDGHYVQVRFDGKNHSLPCNPDALEYVEASS